ncbi:Hypothetical predicted protein [Xyrichtys novacula]|uniref:Uncharacterized protein n=1 Tax=Xyrichtys novacula TaxID=13765 RepID=A0AAV1HK86_XYRNO|nr:Hypothetical predicted protein [Xyrichtys novacula]
MFTENSCLNRHLGGIKTTFFMSQRECVSVCVQVCVGWRFGHLHRQTLCFGSVRLSLRGQTGAKNNVGNGLLLHFCLLSGLFLCALSVRLVFSWTLERYLRRAEVWRDQGTGLERREVVMGTEWQLTAKPSCLSSLSPSPSHLLTRTHVVNRRPAHNQASAQVVSMGSQWPAVQNKQPHWQKQNSL